MPSIHPTAIISDGADIADNVTIGPYCIVGEHVRLGSGIVLHSHVAVAGRTIIGEGVEIFPFASVGHIPQDLKYAGEDTVLEIGAETVIREHVTLNPGTAGGGGVTRVGSRCLLMVGAHVGHDCQIGNGAILVNNATLAGHVEVGDGAILGGLSAVHQFVRIGTQAMVGGMSGVETDVIPYGLVTGNRATLQGLNLVGLKRAGVGKAEIRALRAAYDEIFSSEDGTLRSRVEKAAERHSDNAYVRQVTDFILADSSRSICTPPRR